MIKDIILYSIAMVLAILILTTKKIKMVISIMIVALIPTVLILLWLNDFGGYLHNLLYV